MSACACSLVVGEQLCDPGYGLSGGECVPCDTTSFIKFTDAGLVIVIVLLVLLSWIGVKVLKRRCCPAALPVDADDDDRTVSVGTFGSGNLTQPRKPPTTLQQANVIVKLKIGLSFLQVCVWGGVGGAPWCARNGVRALRWRETCARGLRPALHPHLPLCGCVSVWSLVHACEPCGHRWCTRWSRSTKSSFRR